MATDETKPASSRRRRALMTSAAVIVGLGVIGVGVYKTPFGWRTVHSLLASLSGTHDSQSQFEKLMNQARQALVQNHPDVAIIFLKNAAAAAPKTGEAHFELGEALLKAGDAASAERELRGARQLGAADADVLPDLFFAMLARSEGQQLLAQFPAPADGDKSALASMTLRARAVAMTQTGDSDGAAASLDRALSFDRSPLNLVARAQLAQSTGDAQLAMGLINEALSKSPKDASALLTKVDLLMQANKTGEALAAANDLVKYNPDSPEALMTRAGVYLQLKQHDKAMADINASLKAVPGMALGVYYKALAAEQAQNVKEAWDLAQSLPPAFVNSRAEIGSAVSQMAINAGHMEIGTSILSATVLNYPKNTEARVRLAERYLQLKDSKRALDTLLPVKDSTDPRIMVLLGQAYDLDHNYAKSIEYLEKASATGIGGDLLKRQIAVSNLEAGNLDEAIAELAKLNETAPGDPQTAGPLIDAFLQMNQYGKALDVASKLETAAPKNPYGPLFQGQLLMRQGDMDGAVSAFSHAIANDPKFVPAMYERAAALAARGDLKAADADLKSLLAVDPNNMVAQIKIAQIAIQAGQMDKAEALLKQAAAAHPKDVLPTLVLAGFEVQQGHLDTAGTVIADFLNKAPDNASALAMQGEIQLAAGKFAQAVTTFRQLANTYPQSPQIQMLLAGALAKSGNAKDATSAYRQAAQLAPTAQTAWVGQIQTALANKDNARALSVAQDYATQQPGPASADTLARTYASLNRMSDAVNVLQDSLAKYPNGMNLISLSALYRKQGDATKADTMLTDWVAKHPDDLGVRAAYAEALLSGNPTGAEAQYRAILKAQPYNLTALNNLGWLLQLSDPKAALPYCERAAKIAPDSPSVLDTLAWTKWQLNDKNGALVLLQHAHAIDAKNGEITYHLAVALDGNNRHADAKKTLSELLASKLEFGDKDAAKSLDAKWR